MMRIKKISAILVLAGLSLLAACSSSTWDDAREANTYEAYQAYIDDNPNGEYVNVAKNRADSLYWSSIKNDTTATAFQEYLDQFPDGQFRSEAQAKLGQRTATKGRVTGSSVIIRSDHTTESPSAGVVAKKGTIVQILDRYNSIDSNEAILTRDVTVSVNGQNVNITNGKAIRVLEDLNDSVKASFSTPEYGAVEANISKNDIEAMSGQKWYKIRTNDDITGWIYGKFIEEL